MLLTWGILYMEKLDFTKNIFQKYGVKYDITRNGDILNKSEVKAIDIFNNDKKIDNKNDLFSFGKQKTDNGFDGLM